MAGHVERRRVQEHVHRAVDELGVRRIVQPLVSRLWSRRYRQYVNVFERVVVRRGEVLFALA